MSIPKRQAPGGSRRPVLFCRALANSTQLIEASFNAPSINWDSMEEALAPSFVEAGNTCAEKSKAKLSKRPLKRRDGVSLSFRQRGGLRRSIETRAQAKLPGAFRCGGRRLGPPFLFFRLLPPFFPPTSGPGDSPLDPRKVGQACQPQDRRAVFHDFDSLSKCLRMREPRPSIAVIDATPNPGSSPDPMLPAQDFWHEARVSIPWGLHPCAQDRARVSQALRDWGSGLEPPAFALMRTPDAPARAGTESKTDQPTAGQARRAKPRNKRERMR